MTEKLDIFRVLGNIDQQNFKFFQSLSEDEKKLFIPFIIARWMSGAPDQGNLHAYYLQMTNEFVNKHLWDLQKHPELVWNSMASCGPGQKKRHEWIKGPTRGAKSKIDQVLKSFFPGINQTELHLIKKQLDVKKFQKLLQDHGFQEKEEKELVGQFKKESK